MASVFYFHNGQTADSVKTLIKVLETLDEETFKYHCNKDKNDFYIWLSTGLIFARAPLFGGAFWTKFFLICFGAALLLAIVQYYDAFIRIRQYHVPWSKIKEWSILIDTYLKKEKYPTFRLKTTMGVDVDINPMAYVQEQDDDEKCIASTIALGNDIEALFKLYAADRQGPTKKA